MKIAKEKGIDEVLEFHDILSFVIQKVKPNKNYRDDVFLPPARARKTEPTSRIS